MGFVYQVHPGQGIHIDCQLAHKVSPYARKILLEEISYEGCLASGVLSHQQNHGSGVKVGLVKGGGDKLMEVIGLQITSG